MMGYGCPESAGFSERGEAFELYTCRTRGESEPTKCMGSIHQLETELRLKLFEQLGKKIALTHAGELLVPYARRVVAAVDDARHAIDELQGLERGELRIGASTTPGMYLIPATIAQFK